MKHDQVRFGRGEPQIMNDRKSRIEVHAEYPVKKRNSNTECIMKENPIKNNRRKIGEEDGAESTEK